jgi:hypothetical protein
MLLEKVKIKNDLIASKSIEELKNKVEQYNLSKGELITIAYEGNHKGVDSAIPMHIWNVLKQYDELFLFVMDYQNKLAPSLIHLGEKILFDQPNDYLSIIS